MRERIVIVFIAIAIGLIITTLVFFLYQQTKSLPGNVIRSENTITPTPASGSNVTLIIDEPANESLTERRTIVVRGTTDVGNTVIVSTNQEDIIAEPTADGKFSVSIDIDTGANRIITRAIAPNGETSEDVRIITYHTEEF